MAVEDKWFILRPQKEFVSGDNFSAEISKKIKALNFTKSLSAELADRNKNNAWVEDVTKQLVGVIDNKPKPGDPLMAMSIADPGSGLDGGLYGCTREGFGCSEDNSKKYHGGIDLYAQQNTDLYAMYDGEVISVFDKLGVEEYHSDKKKYSDTYIGSLGNDIQIKSTVNGQSVTFRYCHLNSISVRVGDNVKQGDKIGKTGRNGNAGKIGMDYGSNQPHLHLEITSRADPMSYLNTKFDSNGNKK